MERTRVSLLLAALAAAAVAALAPAAARAAEGKGEYVASWSVSAQAGVAVPNTDEYGSSLAWRLAAGYSPMPQLEVDLELGGFSSGVSQPEDNGIPSHTIASGDLDVRSVAVSLLWRPPLPESYVTLYVLGGVGYYGVDYTMASGPREVFTTGGVAGLPDQVVQDAWGLHAGVGGEYAVTDRVSLIAEGRYLILRPDAKGTASPGSRIDGTLNLNCWLFTGGVKFAF